MPQFSLNGTVIELVPQERSVFHWLANQVYRKLHLDKAPPLPGLLAMMALDAPKQQIGFDDPRPQAVLWTLYQLGFDSVTLDEAQGQVNWQKGTHDDISKIPFVQHFQEEGLTNGRALAASLSVVLQRSIRINGTEMPVRIVDYELLKAQAEELKKRHTNEQADMSLAAARYLAELISGGVNDHDLRLRAALELAADLGIRGLILDVPNQQVRIEAFNEMAALAGAFFQNVPIEQFENAIKRAQALNAAAAETNRKAEEQARAKGGKGAAPAKAGTAAGAGAAAGTGGGQQRIDLSFKRRRR
jgi:hypothetical protein